MAETTSKTVTLQYPVNINGVQYPAGISLDLPKDLADQAVQLSNTRVTQELKRIDGEMPQNVFLGHQG